MPSVIVLGANGIAVGRLLGVWGCVLYAEDSGANSWSSRQPGARRSRLEIVYHVLDVLARHGPLRKTRLMQLANLNTRAFPEYVDNLLVRLGFVARRELGRGSAYALTSKGRLLHNVLRSFARLGLIEDGGAASRASEPTGFVEEAVRLLGELLGGIKVLQRERGYASGVARCGEGYVSVHVLGDVDSLEAYAAFREAAHSVSMGRTSFLIMVPPRSSRGAGKEGRGRLAVVAAPRRRGELEAALRALGCLGG